MSAAELLTCVGKELDLATLKEPASPGPGVRERAQRRRCSGRFTARWLAACFAARLGSA